MSATTASAPTGLILLISAIIGLGIYFAPSALAILKGNVFKGQVIKYQLIILVITIVVIALVSVFGLFLPATSGIERTEMAAGTMATVTDDATMVVPEAEASTASNASGVSILSIICIIGGGIWALISIVLWFYILIHALRDQQMTLLSRFGINI